MSYSVSLTWDEDATAVGFNIYQRQSTSATYTDSTDVGHPTPVGGKLTAQVTVPTSGLWMFAIAAYDGLGNKGAYSQEVEMNVRPRLLVLVGR